MKTSTDSLFFSGTAKFPSSSIENKIYDFITISLEIDIKTEKIINVEATLVLESGNNFLKKLLLYKSLSDKDYKIILLKLENYHCFNNKVIKTALKDLKNQWNMYKKIAC